MLSLIATGVGLLAKLPDLWEGVASIFGKKVPDSVEKAGELASEVGNILAKKEATPEQEAALMALMLPHKERILEMQLDAEKHFASQLTARHTADMQSDSWLSKNCRPLCLLGLTSAIALCMVLPKEYVNADVFRAATDMSQWVYGYYFLGRSAFDKGAVSYHRNTKIL